MTVIGLPSRGVYGSFSANGVVSQRHGPSDVSFTFHFNTTRTCVHFAALGLFTFCTSRFTCVVVACDPGWIQHDYSCYLIVGGSPQVQTTWTDAQQQCMIGGGFLTSTTDRFEHAYLLSQLPASISQVWIGLHLRAGINAYNYIWTDGSPFEFQSWARGQPGSEDYTDRCVEMNPIGGEQPGLWVSANCSSKRGYICEKMRGTDCVDMISTLYFVAYVDVHVHYFLSSRR